MMMKSKLLYATLGVAMLAASCSNDETLSVPVEEVATNAISFKTYVPSALRGTAIGSTADLISGNYTFEIWAFDADGNAFMANETTDGVEISYTTIWDYVVEDERAYWNDVDIVDFYATTPAMNGTFLTGSIDADDAVITYTVPTVCDDQVDLMYTTVLDASKSDRNGTSGDDEPTTGGVPLDFEHALAQVLFSAKTTSTALEIDIESVGLFNVVGKGEFDILTDTWTLGTTIEDFDYTLSTAAVAISTTTVDLTTSTAGAMLMLPQTLTAWDPDTYAIDAAPEGTSYIKLMCKIKGNSGEDYLWGDEDTYAAAYIPFSATWTMGNKYTYTLTFGDAGGNSGGGGYDEDGDPILGDLSITFTPSSGLWSDGDGDGDYTL